MVMTSRHHPLCHLSLHDFQNFFFFAIKSGATYLKYSLEMRVVEKMSIKWLSSLSESVRVFGYMFEQGEDSRTLGFTGIKVRHKIKFQI